MKAPRDSQLGRFLRLHGIASYEDLCENAARDPDWFWRSVMEFHRLHFFKPFDRLLDVSNGPEWAQWCIGGTTNITYNCVDRHAKGQRKTKIAILWEGEPGDARTVSGVRSRIMS